MKLFSAEQTRAWDAYTIQQEPIASLALMDRAAACFTDWFTRHYSDPQHPVHIAAGCGNNGGDGVAVARLLSLLGYSVTLHLFDYQTKPSTDFSAQLARLSDQGRVSPTWYRVGDPLPSIPSEAVLVDALFGSGLSRPLQGAWADLVVFLNHLPNEKVAIDLPSGLFADRHTDGPCIEATRTFAFERPKLAFFFPENAQFTGHWETGSIGLHPDFEAVTPSFFHVIGAAEMRALWRPRAKFAHKGTFGHALLVAGSYGKMGAAVLAARAALRSGVGLLTVHAPRCGNVVLQTAVPEAMFSADSGGKYLKKLPDPSSYRAVGIGCGIGTDPETATALRTLLEQSSQPMVLDADALNLLAQHPEWWPLVPSGSILTPHPKEFERLFGQAPNDFARNDLQRAKARAYQVVILLKGAHTAIATPDGNCYFNTTGNPGMATGGSGDVLTGIITALLAQGYPPKDAALLGAYLHGLAGDLAAAEQGEHALTAGDLVAYLGAAALGLS